jgi:predicted NBD/HSP70 family sugar kinase
MSDIAVIDVGGTSIKYGVFTDGELKDVSSVPTPATLEEYYEVLTEVVANMKGKYNIAGVGMSSPGGVNKTTGVIEGASALPYIHHFNIQAELETRFALPLTIENDANCAALAELKYGAGKGHKDIIFVVIGTGIGGSVIVDGRVRHGKHLFGGEFGYMLLDDSGNIFSELGTAVNMARRYSERVNDGTKYEGVEVFQLAENGDEIALQEQETFYRSLAKGIYNLQYSFDPERIIIGGGVSQADFLIPNIEKRIQAILDTVKIAPFMPEIVPC